MLIIFLVLFVLGLIISVIMSEKVDDYDLEKYFVFSAGFFGVATIILGVILALLIKDIVNGTTIDERIALYEEQNTKIESQIGTLVEKYMDYESNTFEKLKDKDAIALVSLYPELKADTLVSNQCELYIENNKAIIQLKQDKINLKPKKFLVYFGK